MPLFRILQIFLILNMLVSVAIAAPKMDFENKIYDFGKVMQGEKVPHSFKFINSGDEPLLIDRVRSSCGCTAVLLSEKNIAPGQEGEIRANFDSSRFRGEVKKIIYVYSSDPVRPVLQLRIKGQVIEPVAIDPSPVNFGRVTVGESYTAKVVLRNQGDRKITFGPAKTIAPELQLKAESVSLEKGEVTTIEMILSPKSGMTRFSSYIRIPVSGLKKKELRIPVHAILEK